MTKICVIGAGIIGLSSATHIQDAFPDLDLTIIAEKFSPFTTSDVSSSLWMPSSTQFDDRFETWAKKTYDHMIALAMSPLAGEVGAQVLYGHRLLGVDESYSLGHLVKGLKPMTTDELSMFPFPTERGISYMTGAVESYMYLPWLLSRLVKNGATVIQKKLKDLQEIAMVYDIIVNCSGLGALTLVGDKTMRPIRGHVFKVKAPWIKTFFTRYTNDFDTYVLPAVNLVTVGGCFQIDDWETKVRDDESKDIWERCVDLFPAIKHATIVSTQVGLRPYRPRVRLELEHIMADGRTVPIVHNYGHGRHGYSLWKGCAEDVVQLVKPCVERLGVKLSKL